MAELTPKQRRFVEEYLVDLNAAASARRAGYCPRSPKSAAATGSRLLRQKAVREAVREAIISTEGSRPWACTKSESTPAVTRPL